jgi:hypothetical protein
MTFQRGPVRSKSPEPESPVPPSLRSRPLSQPLSRVRRGVLSALLLLAPAVEAAPKSRTPKSSKSGASKTPPATPASQEAPSPSEPPSTATPAAEAPPPVESKPAESKPALAAKPAAEPARSAPRQAARPAAAPKKVEAEAAPGRMRVGVGGDLFLEGSRMTGEHIINVSRIDESFNYNSASFLSGTLWASIPVPEVSERLRLGAGLRILGNYAAGGGRQFGFGLLNETFLSGEYGLPVADQMEVTFGGRAGLSFLVPGQEFAAEIRRLQEQGASVWSVPRVGWLVGPSVGARRRMSERIWLRADVLAQVEQLYLFATTQDFSGYRFTKNWSTLGLRLGLTLGAEFAL